MKRSIYRLVCVFSTIILAQAANAANAPSELVGTWAIESLGKDEGPPTTIVLKRTDACLLIEGTTLLAAEVAVLDDGSILGSGAITSSIGMWCVTTAGNVPLGVGVTHAICEGAVRKVMLSGNVDESGNINLKGGETADLNLEIETVIATVASKPEVTKRTVKLPLTLPFHGPKGQFFYVASKVVDDPTPDLLYQFSETTANPMRIVSTSWRATKINLLPELSVGVFDITESDGTNNARKNAQPSPGVISALCNLVQDYLSTQTRVLEEISRAARENGDVPLAVAAKLGEGYTQVLKFLAPSSESDIMFGILLKGSTTAIREGAVLLSSLQKAEVRSLGIPKGLRRIGQGWESRGGLVYLMRNSGESRVSHVYDHLFSDPRRAALKRIKTSFSCRWDELLEIIDDAWRVRMTRGVTAKTGETVVAMERMIGKSADGEELSLMMIVTRPGTNEVITAYPISFEHLQSRHPDLAKALVAKIGSLE